MEHDFGAPRPNQLASRVGGVRTTNSSGANLLPVIAASILDFCRRAVAQFGRRRHWSSRPRRTNSISSLIGAPLRGRLSSTLNPAAARCPFHALTPPPRGADIVIVVHHASTTPLSSPRSSLSTAAHSNRTKTETARRNTPDFVSVRRSRAPAWRSSASMRKIASIAKRYSCKPI